MKFPWTIVLICGAIVAVLGLRLGYKTVTLSETQIIDHYAKAFLASQETLGAVVDSGHCHALAGATGWERLRVVCALPDGGKWVYPIGWWGQMLTTQPILQGAAQ